MKKFAKIALSCVLAAIILCSVTACGDKPTHSYEEEHTHSYEEEIITPASCTNEGEKRFICSICGRVYTDKYSVSELSANEIYENSKNSIGEIITYNKNGEELAMGTGFSYSTDGKIITNYHVIEDAYSAKITINGMNYTIQSVLAYNKSVDLAVLQINANGLNVLSICKKNHAVGQTVYAFGSSQGLTDTFSQGMITYADRELDGVHYVQHDAAISAGNSGGPLINQYGEIIGINTMSIKNSQNLNFAISVNEIDNLTYGTPLTVAQFYEKECDAFSKVKNYVIQNGTYNSSNNKYTVAFGSIYSSDYSSKYSRGVIYDATEDVLVLILTIINKDYNYDVLIYIDEIDGIYTWAYFDSKNYYMIGTLFGLTFTSDTLLGYSDCNISFSELRSSTRKLASSMVSLLVTYTNLDFAVIGVTAADLGFVNF